MKQIPLIPSQTANYMETRWLNFGLSRVFCVLQILGLVIGIFAAIIIPPFVLPDEPAHFLRAYEISRLHLVNTPERNGVPISCSDYLVIGSKYAPMAYFQDVREQVIQQGGACSVLSLNSANIYSPVPYLAGGLAIALGDGFGLSVEEKLYFARILTCILCASIIGWGLKGSVAQNHVLLFLIFTPLCFFIRSSVSADAITMSLLIAFTGKVISSKKAPEVRGDLIALIALGFLLGSCKLIYGAYAAISLILIRKEHAWFGNIRSAGLYALPSVAALVGAVMWLPRISPYIGNNANPAEQLQLLISQPGHLFRVMATTYTEYGIAYLHQFFLPPGGYPIWIPNSVNFILILALTVLSLSTPLRLALLNRIFLIVLSASFFVIILVPLYLTYAPVGYKVALGLQGRYYFPAVLGLSFALFGLWRSGDSQPLRLILVGLPFSLTLLCVGSLL
ncbi:hypothetical protein BB934_05285 [Microvirga ossetica]|uniref:Glycosyltransferase RgtA/B/C/D-like domain-containing protein n=1 Tax=Microvirga ossetica TaxID=1882682 RepID=A0A1B2ECN5_9HYPH|nr:DUF2142 domain-containing protein [Microvirga ossetica]ANY77718.1 hypothetical protein BB934_05285 [Microvirga ossetica]